MLIRFTGEGIREVPLQDGSVVIAERMEWVAVPRDVALELNKQDVWELEAPKKAAKTRAANEETD